MVPTIRTHIEIGQGIGGRVGLSAQKYGFIKGKSTVEAVNTIIEAVRSSLKKRIALTAVDVTNAFICHVEHNSERTILMEHTAIPYQPYRKLPLR